MLGHHLRRILNGVACLLIGAGMLEDVGGKNIPHIMRPMNAMWHDQDIAGRDAIWSKRWGIAPSIKLGLEGPTSLAVSYYHLDTDELPDSGIPYLYTIGNAPAGVTEIGPAQDLTTIGGRQVSVPRGAYYGLKAPMFPTLPPAPLSPPARRSAHAARLP